MRPYTPARIGTAQYNSWTGIQDANVPELATGSPLSSYFAQMVYVVGGSQSSTSNDFISSDMTVISGAQIAISNTAVGLGTIDPSARIVRISFTGSGDVRLTYDGTSPIGGSLGEIWFKGGLLSVNASVSSNIKLIRDGSTDSSIYVTQFA